MLRESIVIGRIYGIPIKIHFSFLLIIPFLAWTFGNNIEFIVEQAGVPAQELVLNPFFSGLIMALALFVSVGIHELAHSLVAQKLGLTIDSITLMLFGGIAQMEGGLEDPRKEVRIAVSGPAASLAIGLLLLLFFTFISFPFFPDLRVLGIYLGQLNIFLAFFNLLPAFPTDGGRIVRALLARWVSYLQATRIASSLGRTFAFLFGILGLMTGNFIMIFIAIFIFIGASQEYQQTLFRTTLSDFKVKEIMTQEVSSVEEETTVKELLGKMMNERHSGYPVVSDEELRGCVTMEDIRKVEPEKYDEYQVKDIMSQDIRQVKPEDDLQDALGILSREDIGRLMVVQNGELVGIITRSDIMKGFRLRQFQHKIEKRESEL